MEQQQFKFSTASARLVEVAGRDIHLVVNDENSSSARQRLEAIISRIPREEWIQRSPAELAESCGCSLRHLRRLFRRCFGVSLRTQQTEFRLQKASQLLAETEDKIVSIAWASGFRHLGLFSRMFRKRFRMTPSQWRATHRHDAN